MNGGTISNNTAGNFGGGVFVAGGTFNMNNGEIAGNKAVSGGGVYIFSGTFTMTGGEIYNNTVTVKGGGVYVNDGSVSMDAGNFNMTGGTVYGNASNAPPGKANTAVQGGAALGVAISGIYNGEEQISELLIEETITKP